jgi:glutaredoxin-related protein
MRDCQACAAFVAAMKTSDYEYARIEVAAAGKVLQRPANA